MTDVILITPPDKIFNKNRSILLVCPSAQSKSEIQKILVEDDVPTNIYLYKQDTNDIDWLLSVHRLADIVILDLDEMPSELRSLDSYLISYSNTFWLTKAENMLYTKISNNKIYNFDFLKTIMKGGEELEK